MTQTVNGQKKVPQKQSRPGQRQQERLMRLERRRRRRRIWGSTCCPRSHCPVKYRLLAVPAHHYPNQRGQIS